MHLREIAVARCNTDPRALLIAASNDTGHAEQFASSSAVFVQVWVVRCKWVNSRLTRVMRDMKAAGEPERAVELGRV